MLKVQAVPALQDNYIWVLYHEGETSAVAVDPGESTPVMRFLEKEKLELTSLLITHRHWDHTGGIEDLVEKFGASVYAPAHERTPIACVTAPVGDGDEVRLPELGVTFGVMAIPGHTLGHIAYYGENCLFSGDTLFSGGCGKVFEGSARQMVASLSRLAGLPKKTQLYCGHEYTCKNLTFASVVEPGNPDIRDRLSEARAAREKGAPTLPSRIGDELEINPFLRCKQELVARAAAEHVGSELTDVADIFGALRAWKDNFRP